MNTRIETEKMKKATNLAELHHAFEHSSLEEKDKDFYIDIYAHELKKMRTSLMLTNQNPNATFYIAGQTGNGKTTALNFLPIQYPEISEKYQIIHLSNQQIFSHENIDIIDILLMSALMLIEKEQSLEKKFLDNLIKFQETKSGELEISKDNTKNSKIEAGVEASVSVGANFWGFLKTAVDIKSKYLTSKEVRDSFKSIFKLDKDKLLSFLNEVILEYEATLEGKKLFLMIDDLEKKTRSSNTDKLFDMENKNIFKGINCIKYIMMPMYLLTDNATSDIFIFSTRINSNPFGDNTAEDDTAKRNKEFLKKMIERRIETRNIIDDEAIECIVDLSGGNLRQISMLIQEAVSEVLTNDRDNIKKYDIQKAKESIAGKFSFSFSGRIEFLHNIKQNNINGDNEDKFKDSILDNMIFAYLNGEVWYEINPIIKDTIDSYYKRIAKQC